MRLLTTLSVDICPAIWYAWSYWHIYVARDVKVTDVDLPDSQS
jgi:hypothetical protein